VVTDAAGTAIRHFTQPVRQGINRLSWDQRHDGVRPPPGPKPPEKDADLPTGAEVPPGQYHLSLSLPGEDENRAEQSIEVTVLADPRPGISAAGRESNYRSLLALQELQEAAVSAVERIVRTRSDLDTVERLIGQQAEAADNETLQGLKEKAASLRKGLDAQEAHFRVAPETKGYVYNDDKVFSQIEVAQFYLGSSLDAGTAASKTYVDLASSQLQTALAEMNRFFDTEVSAYRRDVEQAGIALLSSPNTGGH
jgi:hypothetical protein